MLHFSAKKNLAIHTVSITTPFKRDSVWHNCAYLQRIIGKYCRFLYNTRQFDSITVANTFIKSNRNELNADNI